MYITHRMRETFPFQTMWNGRAFAVIDIMRNEYVDEYVSEDVALAQVKALNTKFQIEQRAKTQAYWAIEKAKGTDKDFAGVSDSLWARIAEFVRNKLKAMA
jgi:hypothetical protein